MKNDEKIKEEVRERYAAIVSGVKAPGKQARKSGSCSCGENREAVALALNYSNEDRASVPDGADLGLGCGTPTAYADLEEGMTVLDLGSGAGIDCFIAARHVGKSGQVIGVDMTLEMIEKANENKLKVGAENVTFRLGEIESLPVESGSVDRVISNCVINLVPNKSKAFSEIHRVLRFGGKFTVSDIVTDGAITDDERRDASLWAGCVSGALDRNEYLGIIGRTGFRNITVSSESRNDYELSSGAGLFSITVTGEK